MSLVHHTKFHKNQTSGSWKEDFFLPIYQHGSHIGHVASIMLMNFHFLVFSS